MIALPLLPHRRKYERGPSPRGDLLPGVSVTEYRFSSSSEHSSHTVGIFCCPQHTRVHGHATCNVKTTDSEHRNPQQKGYEEHQVPF